jgi:hypothetical protein
MKRWIFLVVALLAALVPMAAVGAQGNSYTLTEDEINSSYRVTNPARRSVSNLSVDLQPGQASIAATITRRAPRGAGTTSYNTVAIYTPEVREGRIYWTLQTATVDGQPATQELIDQINAALGSSWRNYIRGQRPGRVASVTITEDAITVTMQ